MALSIVMPALEMAQETGKILSWLKREGERVSKGQPLLEVETDKAVVEVEAPGDGILGGIRAQAGAVVPVGQTIAWLLAPGETVPAETPDTLNAVLSGRQSDAGTASTPVAAAPSASATSQPVASEIKISPKARRLAREQSVDIARLRGSGPGGEILAADILAAAQAQPAPQSAAVPAAASAAETLSVVGRLMAERTTQSWTTVPHFFLVRELDAGALAAAQREFAAEIERSRGVKPTITDLLVLLVARTLRKHPRLNASWAGDRIRDNEQIHIGVAMAVEDGVVVGVIRDAASANLADIAVARNALAERARSGKLQPGDIAGATFTISNLGMYGVDAFTAIIVPPQAAILAVGRIADRVVAAAGHPAVRPMLTLTLSSDHRVVDGARAAEFMRDLAAAIGEPQRWLPSLA